MFGIFKNIKSMLGKIRYINIFKFRIVYIIIDLENKEIIIPEDFNITFLGDVKILSKKNIDMNSNYKEIDPATNKPYSIRLNCGE